MIPYRSAAAALPRTRAKGLRTLAMQRDRFAHLLVAATFAAALAAGAARADDGQTIKLTIASSHSTSLAWVGTMHTLVVPEANKRLAALGSPYQIRWTEAYGGSLY